MSFPESRIKNLKFLVRWFTKTRRRKIFATFFLMAVLSLSISFFYLKKAGKPKLMALEVKVITPETKPELFYLKDDQGKFVPFIIEHKDQGATKEVSLRAKGGVQKFIFKRRSEEILLFFKADSQKLFNEVANARLYPEYLSQGKWIRMETAKEYGLTSKENGSTVSIIKFERYQEDEKKINLETVVEIGMIGDRYISKWSFKLTPLTQDGSKFRLVWEIQAKKDFDQILLDANDFEGPKQILEEKNKKVFIFFPEGETNEIVIDPTLSVSTTSSTISVTSNQTPSWRAVWDSSKGGLISEFYTPSSSSTNIVQDSGSQRNQNLCNLRLAVSSGTSESTAASDQYSRLRLIEATSTRVKIRTEGNLETDSGSTDNGDFWQDFIIYPDKILCNGWVAWGNSSNATVFEHSFNFKANTFSNNSNDTSLWLGDNDTTMSLFSSATTWQTATNITYDAPGPVAVLQIANSDTDITIFSTEVPFQVAQDNQFYWENSSSFDKFAWGGDGLIISNGETIAFGSLIKITNDNTSDGSEGRKYALDFWNNDSPEITEGQIWDSIDEAKGRLGRSASANGGTDFIIRNDRVFSDGFETGGTTNWDNEVDDGGNFNIVSSQKRSGNYSAQITLGSNPAYVEKRIRIGAGEFTTYHDVFAIPVRLRVRFYLNPNNISMASGDFFTILSDATVEEFPFYFVQMGYNGTNYQVRAGLEHDYTGSQPDGCSTGQNDECTGWVNIDNNKFNLVEVEWGIINTNGYVRIWVNGAFGSEDNLIDAGNNGIDMILFGYIAGRDAGTSGSIFLDDLKFNIDRKMGDVGFNLQEGIYSASSSQEKVSLNLSSASFQRFSPSFEFKNQKIKSLNFLSLNNQNLKKGVNFNADQIPFSRSYFSSRITFETTLDSPLSATSSAIGSGGQLFNSGGLSFNRARFGKGMRSGNWDSYLQVPPSQNFDNQSGGFECWYNPAYNHTDNTFHYVCLQTNDGTNEFAVAKDDNAGVTCNSNPNCLSLYMWRGASSTTEAAVYFTQTQYSFSNNGDWHHILAIWDASLTTTDDLQLYLDGVKATGRVGAGGAFLSSPYSPTEVRIGRGETQDEVRIFDFADGGTPIRQLSAGGDTSNANEYLADSSKNFTLSFTDDDSANRAEYLFLGADEKFSGILVELATKGVGSNLDLSWEYWAQGSCPGFPNGGSISDYCWKSLETTPGFYDGTENFTKDGIVSFNLPPKDWVPYSVNGSPDLYFVRVHLEQGSYSTYPVESRILTDVSVFQYLGKLEGSQKNIFEFPNDTSIASWKFDEITSLAKDSSGFENDLTLSGATHKASGSLNSRTNRASYLSFDGVNDYLSRSQDTDFDFSRHSFSITGWFRHPSTISGQDTILANSNGVSGVGYKIYMNSSGNLCFAISDTQGSFPLDSACSSSSFLDSTWHHFAAVKDATSSISLFVDGKQVAQDSSLSANGTINPNSSLYIGIDADGSSNPWTGDLDEINIHNFALSQAQILAEIPDPTSALFGSNPTDPLTNGLVGYWKMDEASNGTVQTNRSDSSGNATTLTDVNTTASGFGKFRVGADFESDNSEYLYANDNPTLSITGSLTISAWIRPESNTAGSVYNIVAKWDGTNRAYRLAQTGDEIALELDNSGDYVITTSSNLQTSTFYHVVGVYDSENASAKIFINGVEAPTSTSGTIPSSIGDDSSRFHIGAANSSISANQFYDGIIDEVRVYNRALSPFEVQKLYEWAPGPVGWWKFDEATGTTANDSSGNGNNGTFFNPGGNAPLWQIGKFGGSLYFYYNGTQGNGIEVQDNDILDFDQNTSFTLEAWIRVTGSDAYGNFLRIITHGNLGMTEPRYVLAITSSNTYTCAGGADEICLGVIDPDGDTYEITTNNDQMTVDYTWKHVAVTFDRTSESNSQIFLNGIPQTVVRSGVLANIGSLANSDVFCIGTGNAGAVCGYEYESFFGNIDDVRVYDYVRTPAQIIEDMNAGHPAPGSPIGSATGYWKFDDLAGTIAQDSSNNNLDLTLSPSASWTISGKFSGAWNGLGTNRVGITDANSSGLLDPLANEDFSISFWARSDSSVNPSSNETVIDKQASSPGYSIWFDTSGRINCGIDDDALGFPEDSATTSKDFYDATWHHFVCIRNITQGRLYLYVDGKLEAQDSNLSATGSLNNIANFLVGDSDTSDNGDEFNGDIDELKFYRFALTPSQVLLEMNHSSTSTLGDVADQENETFGGNPPFSWYKFDENSGTSQTKDSSGRNNNCTFQNMTESFWRPGKFGSAFYTNDTNNASTETFCQQPDDIYDSLSQGTVEVWFKPDDTGDNWQDILGSSNSSGGGLEYFYERSTNSFGYWTSTGVEARASVPDPQTGWHHGVLRISSTGNRFFIDGKLTPATYASGSSSSTNFYDDIAAGTTLNYIGCYPGPGQSQECFPSEKYVGLIDEIKIYDYPRSNEQIAYDYNRGAPVAWYKFDECSGTTAYNSSLSPNGDALGLNASIVIGSSGSNIQAGSCTSGGSQDAWYNGASGKFNSSLDFDGTDDYAQVSDDFRLDFIDEEDFTIEAWFKRDTSTSDDTIVAKKNDQTTGVGYILFIDDVNDNLNFVVSDGTNSFSISGRTAITDSNWHHVVARFDEDSATNSTIFLDGRDDKNTTSGTIAAVGSLANSLNLRIGSESDGQEFFDGKIDNLKIYNYAMPDALIGRLYNGGEAVRF